MSDPNQEAAHTGDQIERELESVRNHLREGKFQRSLSLLVSGASLVSGLEVAYEHYRGSYGQRIMYTPVALSALLFGAGLGGFFSGSAARSGLRVVSALTLADAIVGFGFHVRGIARKQGGWRMPLTNIIMGPPIFAPLLFGTAAYLGLVASFLRREDSLAAAALPQPAAAANELLTIEQDVREGRFQQHMLLATALSAALSGSEAWYSHYKSGFRYATQWLPVVLAPLLALTSAAAIRRRGLAKTAVPTLATAALAVASVGFFLHARGILRRPGGTRYLLYNVMYGPPIFAPLLFGAAGGLGLLASQLRRSER